MTLEKNKQKNELVDKNLFEFKELMEEVSKLSDEKQEKVCIFVQGMLAGINNKKLN